MREPGGLKALGEESTAAWQERVRERFDQTTNSLVVQPDDPRVALVTVPDWTGFPLRIARCLTRERAMTLLDRSATPSHIGGRALQEEYLEWRAVAGTRGLQRVELTTELGDYWAVLAGYEPDLLLETVAEFAGESVAGGAVYGDCDPQTATVEERRRAFERTMLRSVGCSPYNDGRRAICCLIQETNTLGALVDLMIAATVTRLVRDTPDEPLRCLTCDEAIPMFAEKAQSGRGSDPVFVERLGRLAYEGRLVTLDEPVGIYIQDVEHTRLRTPDGQEVPREWFTLSRGQAAHESADGRARYQRATLEVPATERFSLGDLVDVATEERIAYGGQIADLLQLVVFFRASAPDAVATDRETAVELGATAADPRGCLDVRAAEARLALRS